jgi:heptosyltransferase-2/heptosyltransferase-3
VQSPPQRIAVIKPCCIGDCVMALPAVDALATAFPNAELEVLVGAHSAPIFAGRPAVSATCVITDIPKARDVPALAGLLRRGSYDLVVLLDRSRWLRLAVAMSGARRVIRVRDPREGFQHEGDLYLTALAAAEIETPLNLPSLQIPNADRVAAADLLRRRCRLHEQGERSLALRETVARRDDSIRCAQDVHCDRPSAALNLPPFAVIHPGGAMNPGVLMLQKRWPADRHIELARALRERGLDVLLSGGPDEVELAARIAREAELHEDSNLAGQLTLLQVAALVEQADLYVGADTGVSHLAAATGTPSVVIFGPTNPLRYGPRGPRVEIVAPVESYQIANVDLRHGPGVARSVATTRVTVVEVLAACERLLQRRDAS